MLQWCIRTIICELSQIQHLLGRNQKFPRWITCLLSNHQLSFSVMSSSQAQVPQWYREVLRKIVQPEVLTRTRSHPRVRKKASFSGNCSSLEMRSLGISEKQVKSEFSLLCNPRQALLLRSFDVL